MLGPGQIIVLWANPCHSASLPAESVRNSSFSKPEPRQTDAGRRMIRCCLTSTQYGTCLQCWADSAVWTCSHTAQLLRRQDSAGCSVLFFACNGVMKIGGVRALFFFIIFFFYYFPVAHVLWAFWVQIKVMFLCCGFAVLGCAWAAFMVCCWTGQWPEPAWMAWVLLDLSDRLLKLTALLCKMLYISP